MCDLTTIVKDHMKTLMRVFEQDLADYNMKEVTTKCLNTAVLVLYMFLGARALHHTFYCDVENVAARANEFQNRQQAAVFWNQMQRHIHHCRNSCLRKPKNAAKDAVKGGAKRTPKSLPDTSRCLYYIMITHAETPDHGMFPGHVFILDKSYQEGMVNYDMYQSYIQEYDLAQYIGMNSGSTRKSHAYVQTLLDGLHAFFTKKVWDKECSAWWQLLTHVNGEAFEGYPIQNTIFFCYQEIPIHHCTTKLAHMLRERAMMQKDPATQQELKRIVQKLKDAK